MGHVSCLSLMLWSGTPGAGTRLGQLQLSEQLSGIRQLSGAVRSCPVLPCGGWATDHGLSHWLRAKRWGQRRVTAGP